VIANVETMYRQLVGARSHRDPLEIFAVMAGFDAASAQGA
jgi:hypothetical protein